MKDLSDDLRYRTGQLIDFKFILGLVWALKIGFRCIERKNLNIWHWKLIMGLSFVLQMPVQSLNYETEARFYAHTHTPYTLSDSFSPEQSLYQFWSDAGKSHCRKWNLLNFFQLCVNRILADMSKIYYERSLFGIVFTLSGIYAATANVSANSFKCEIFNFALIAFVSTHYCITLSMYFCRKMQYFSPFVLGSFRAMGIESEYWHLNLWRSHLCSITLTTCRMQVANEIFLFIVIDCKFGTFSQFYRQLSKKIQLFN